MLPGNFQKTQDINHDANKLLLRIFTGILGGGCLVYVFSTFFGSYGDRVKNAVFPTVSIILFILAIPYIAKFFKAGETLMTHLLSSGLLAAYCLISYRLWSDGGVVTWGSGLVLLTASIIFVNHILLIYTTLGTLFILILFFIEQPVYTVTLASSEQIGRIGVTLMMCLMAYASNRVYRRRLFQSYHQIEEISGQRDEITALYEEVTASEEELRCQFDELAASELKNREYEDKIFRLAMYDELSGLPNKTLCMETLQHAIDSTDSFMGVVSMDIVNLKYFNNIFGFLIGDKIVQEVARIISQSIMSADRVARYGGDEFVIIVRSQDNREGLEQLVRSILAKLTLPLRINDHAIHVSVIAGLAIYPEDSRHAEDLRKYASLAKHYLIDYGGENMAFFQQSIKDLAMERMFLEEELRAAVANQEFILHYQPQVDIDTGKIYGFEALVRWNSAKHGLVYPGNFIEVCEKTGLINPLGNWVLQEACRFARRLLDKGYAGMHISVNLSIVQVMQSKFTDMVMESITNASIQPANLILEITESMYMEANNENLSKLNFLRQYGVHISLDDFGKGYSSLGYLKDLPISILKIDKCFLDDVKPEGTGFGIVRAIITMAHDLGLKVVAEGVETGNQLEYLTRHGCNYAQGYFFSRPVMEDRVFYMLENGMFLSH